MLDAKFFECRLKGGIPCKVRPKPDAPDQFQYRSTAGWYDCDSQENAEIRVILKARKEQETLRKDSSMKRTIHQRIALTGDTTLDQLTKIPSPQGSWYPCAWVEGAFPDCILIGRDQYGIPRVEYFVRPREGCSAQTILAMVGLLLDARALQVADGFWFETPALRFTPKTLPEGKRLEWGIADISFSWDSP